MGLLENLQQQAITYLGKEYPQAAEAIKGLIDKHGGIAGVITHFKNQGLGEVVNSWVSTGKNLPISSEQIQKILGNDVVKNLAAKFGTTPEAISQQVSQHLPNLIDKLTPNGGLPSDGIVGKILGVVKGLMGGNKTAALWIALGLAVAGQAQAAKKLNINTATQEELESLPGVGPALAQKIMAARPLTSAKDLESIPGIGEKDVKKMKKLVSFSKGKKEKKNKADKDEEKEVTETAEMKKEDKVEKKGILGGLFSKKEKKAKNEDGDDDAKSISAKAATLADGEIININTASASELEKLPGIGAKKAQMIIEARPIKSKEELLNIKGIGEATLSKIEGSIRF